VTLQEGDGSSETSKESEADDMPELRTRSPDDPSTDLDEESENEEAIQEGKNLEGITLEHVA
jgi:hypothetical protein